ncbi:antitoxin MazE-like protein [Methylobacterium dankookense]|uniref:Antitoxin MazE n=1 Tax=Methylobacterium dankookense TaxID=560405 RepID=A0A564FZ56_9HYPH|nr:antitoxin MazE-like protein [Methylobacterium dankookense]GJD58855.1 hypothetical protein IFDJLNFL_4781 [Methylobacterium dankookense]VUF13469.1 hypothetical protein MTDSW087_03172 [Methylobacterium dankookense]
MARTKPDDGPTKSHRDRRSQGGRGMKLLRVWVPDPSASEFQAEARRQAALLRGAAEDEDALRFIEAATDWPEA